MYLRRNVWCQLKTIRHFLSVIKENAEKIIEIVAEGRKKLTDKDVSIEKEERQFVLKHGKSKTSFFKTEQKAYDYKGNIIDEENVIYFPKRDVMLKKTVKPAAYVLPCEDAEAEKAVALLEKHNIYVRRTKRDVCIQVAQYYMTDEGIILSKEKLTHFDGGAFIIPVAQAASNIVCILMEPESADSRDNNGSLIQQEIMKVNNDNKFNIYRTMSSEYEKQCC